MNITANNASKIVNEINNIINQKINIIDTNGVIISSTDPSRIGQFHEGAKRLIDQQLDQLVIENDNKYTGTKKGINFPIIVDNSISGVIGITGEYDEVIKYAQLIKRLTEILLLEATANEQKIIAHNIVSNYLYEWISRNKREITQQFINRGLELNIDITIPRRIVVLSLTQNITKLHDEKIRKLLYNVEELLKDLLYNINEKNLIIKTSTNIVCCFIYMNDDKLKSICTFIKDTIYKKHNLKISMGIDEDCKNHFEMYVSYNKAEKALNDSFAYNSDIIFYKDLKFEIFSDEISLKSKQDFIDIIFNEFSVDEIRETIYTLEILYRFNGSITLTSEFLHIHKNTLQYKLKKIFLKTGHDPRSISEAGIFQIAIFFANQVM